MRYRRLGRTNRQVSEIGMGTCQLRMLPVDHAIDTLVTGFQSGMNVVHTAADYGDALGLVQEAVGHAEQEILVCANGWGSVSFFEELFEDTRARFGRPTPSGRVVLDMFGIASVEDRELLGEDVWGPDGLVAFLDRKKREGTLIHTFCTSHGSPRTIQRLIESGSFDAVMFAYNILGHHLLSFHPPDDREREDIAGNRMLFPLAERNDVGVMVMEVLAGGLLCEGGALSGRPTAALQPSAHDVLRHLLNELPTAACLMPGTASPAEARQNAEASGPPVSTSPDDDAGRTLRLERRVEELRTSHCNRCGSCEDLCSQQLPVSWLFRASDIEHNGAVPFETPFDQRYFDLHPAVPSAACAGCQEQSCLCPEGIDIPAALIQRHGDMIKRWEEGACPGPTPTSEPPIAWAARWEAGRLASEGGVLTLRNTGTHGWHVCSGHAPRLEVRQRGRLIQATPLRTDVPAGASTWLPLGPLPLREDEPYGLEIALDPPGTPSQHLNLGVFPPLIRRPAPSVQPASPYGAAFPELRCPASMPPSARFDLWVRIRNTGSMTWGNAEDQQVRATVWIQGDMIASADLPGPVAPGEATDVHLVVPAPVQPGLHRIDVNLVHEGVCHFQDRAVASGEAFLTVTATPPPPGAALHAVGMEHNWSFYLPAGGVSRLGDGTPMPQILERARGPYVWDTDDRRYIDYTMGWGCALLGHGHPLVEANVMRAMGCGPTLPLPHRLEMELTEALCQTAEIPCAEAVAFGKNGSDVCSLAIRLARLATGRSTIVAYGYHGWQDWYAEPLGFTSTGVPERHPPLVVRPDTHPDGEDMQGVLAAIRAHREDLAAVILEPSGASGGPRMVSGASRRDALEAVATAARAAGAIVIFDEIITGFRVPQGSVQKDTGVVPDLACFGKALGNGYPISALVGRRDLMTLLTRAFYGPTFKGEIHSIAAALTALSLYRAEPVAAHVDGYGTLLQNGIEDLCRQHGVRATMAGPSFRTVLDFEGQELEQIRLMRALYLQELLRGGIITYAGVMLPSFAHTPGELDLTLRCVDAALQRVARCCDAGSQDAVRTALHRALEMPPPPPVR